MTKIIGKTLIGKIESDEVDINVTILGAGPQGEPGKDGADGLPGKDGEPGKDGVSVTHSWTGTTLNITSASGTSSANLKGSKGDPGEPGLQGPPGKDGVDGLPGKDGHTPVKGVDYFTEQDKAEIVTSVLSEIPVVGNEGY